MTTRKIKIVVGFVSVLLAGSAFALDPPHDATYNITCDDCHAIHGTLVPRDAEQAALCKSCHNPTDPNAGGMSDVNDHVVNGGVTIIDCGSCHDVHGPQTTTDPHSGGQTAVNLKLIRGDTAKYVADACEPAIFQQSPGHFAFGSSNQPYNGICQSCHIATDRHTNDGLINHNPGTPANNDHEIGANCTACHTHAGGFAATGGSCITCHDKVQDQDPNDGVPARRAVVGAGNDFSSTSHHVAAGAVTDADCAVCHMESETDHKNGLIDLRNPDTGTALTGFTQFTRDTASETLETWVTDVQNNFCLKCHDADGATATAIDPNNHLQPFSVGTRDVPDVFDSFDSTNSFYHPVRAEAGNPYCVPSPNNGNQITMESPWNQDSTHDVISCFDCHVANGHGDPNQRMLRAAIDFDTMEGTTNPANLPAGMGATVEAFCSMCHKASVYVNASDPEAAGSIFEHHPGSQNQHSAAGGNELGCMGCHAGVVDFGPPASDNGALPGNSHGGTFTWPAGTFSSGTQTEHFMLGGWIGGWATGADKQGNPMGYCSGGDCNHSGTSTKSGQNYTR